MQILAPMELCFPSYDGNGMYLSMGNIEENPAIQMLFIDFEQPNRVRVSGERASATTPPSSAATPAPSSPCTSRSPTCSPNCPRYIHRTGAHELSSNVPDASGAAPIAEWKCMPIFTDVLAADDPARAQA